MAEKGWLLGDTPNPLGDRVDEIRAKLKDVDPNKLAARTGAIYTLEGGSGGEFRLAYWSREVIISFPDFSGNFTDTGEAINTFDITMLAYYFDVCDGAPMTNQWIAFNQIPGGLFYAQRLHTRQQCGEKLLKIHFFHV